MAWSYEAFLAEGALLVERSARCAAQKKQQQQEEDVAVWEWRQGRRANLPGSAYLVSCGNIRRRQRSDNCSASSATVSSASDAMDDISAILQGEIDEIEVPDPACLSGTEGSEELIVYEFHIVYHVVYQTPVLYFRLSQLDGTPVRFDGSLARELRLPGGNDRATLVSMEEHQVLGSPFYSLHPCETASAMTLLLSHVTSTESSCDRMGGATRTADPTYLLAWLSLVQPLTQIDPRQYSIESESPHH